MNDYLLHEMARIRIDELRAEASRAARGAQGWRHHLGILAGSLAARGEAEGFYSRTVEEGCCA